MTKSTNRMYFVEGEDEKRLLEVLKTDMRLILPGKISVFNVIQDQLTQLRISSLKQGTIVILVFDTDINKVDMLKTNIDFLKRQHNIGGVICIPQVRNLEDELKRSCNIKNIRDLTGSRSDSDFKRDFIRMRKIKERLEEVGFDIHILWTKQAKEPFDIITNGAEKIKG